MNSSATFPMILRSVASSEILWVNAPFEERLGLTREELAAGSLLDWIHPEDRNTLEPLVNAGFGRAKARHRSKQDEWTSFDWHVRTHDGRVVALGLLGGDVDTSPALANGGSRTVERTLSETLDAMARIVEVKNPGLRCSILLVDHETSTVTVGAGPSLPDEYNAIVEGLAIGPAVGSCGTAAYWNTPVIVENIAEDVLWKDLRDTAAVAGVAACWSHSVTTTAGVVLGAVALYDDEPGAPTQGQMDGLEIVARMVALAVERDRLEEQLREDMFLTVFDHAKLGIAIGNAQGNFVAVNPALCEMLGYPENELVGRSWADITHPDDHAEDARLAERLLTGEEDSLVREKRFISATGAAVWVRASATLVRSEAGEIVAGLGLIEDITRRRKQDEAMLTAIHHEHVRLGQDLHDGVAQDLVGAQLLCASLGPDLSPADAGRLAVISSALQDALDGIKNVSRGLLSVPVRSLVRSLEHLADSVADASGVSCHIRSEGPDCVTEGGVSQQLFRIAQEAVTNAIRHGEAGTVWISLTRGEDRITLEVVDDGTGFGPVLDDSEGLGLGIMRARSASIGGGIQVGNNPEGPGARVCCWAPCCREE